ncbi:MAG: threonine--tRNA ligase [Bacteroidales bacterium]
MIKLTLPDGSVREVESGMSGFDFARSISNQLAKEALSIEIDGEVRDLTTPLNKDANVNVLTWDTDGGKHTFWHSSAHLLAEAIEALYPGTKFGIGPTVDVGFYYDIDLPEGMFISENDFPVIEKKMLELARQKNNITRQEISKADALKLFGNKGDEYKTELIGELEDGTITLYSQGNFTDLCRGPHLRKTEQIKAIKLTAVAGAYWRGNDKNKQLTRIYGITFPKQKMLEEYLVLLEEAKNRDHRKIGKELELFTFSQNVGQGLPMWLPKGAMLREQLELFLKKVQKKYGYSQVITPHIGNIELYKKSGHYEKYGKDSFQPILTPAEGESYLLKPMNCPHHCELYAAKPRSYRDLPLRLAEFGTVYRYEMSGELHGLTRVRGFTQDDAHIFCRPDQLKEEFLKVIDIIFIIFNALDFEEYTAQISLRDPNNTTKYIGTSENWDKAEQSIIEACKERGLNTVIELGEAAFYGPKLDFMIKDALGRSWQLGTIQVDYNLPERFGLEYIGADDQKHRPVMIHRAPFGSMERFVAVLIEHTAGKFPLWLSPDQVVVLPIGERFNEYAHNLAADLNSKDIRTIVDDRNEKVGRKIRDNELKRIPYLLVVGEAEMEEKTVSIRRQGEGDKGKMNIDDFVKYINEQIDIQMNSHNIAR